MRREWTRHAKWSNINWARLAGSALRLSAAWSFDTLTCFLTNCLFTSVFIFLFSLPPHGRSSASSSVVVLTVLLVTVVDLRCRCLVLKSEQTYSQDHCLRLRLKRARNLHSEREWWAASSSVVCCKVCGAGFFRSAVIPALDAVVYQLGGAP